MTECQVKDVVRMIDETIAVHVQGTVSVLARDTPIRPLIEAIAAAVDGHVQEVDGRWHVLPSGAYLNERGPR